MASRYPTLLSLQAGETRLLRLSAGDQLFAAQGGLRLTEPTESMDDQAWRLRRALRCGEGHAVTRAGAVRVEALDEPVLLQLRPAPAWHSDTLPACDPRPAAASPIAARVWRWVERLATTVAAAARQRQHAPS